MTGTFSDGLFSDGTFSDGMFSDGMFGDGMIYTLVFFPWFPLFIELYLGSLPNPPLPPCPSLNVSCPFLFACGSPLPHKKHQ